MRDVEERMSPLSRDRNSLDSERLLLWERSRPSLEVYLQSFSGLGPEGVDETLQRTLIALWEKGGELGADARPWLFRVARNAALDMLRSSQRASSRLLEPGLEGPDRISILPSSYPGPEDGVLAAEEESLVATFVAGLPDGDRELLALAYAEGMSYPEIAALLGRPLGTVKWKIAELKRRLGRLYRKEFGHE